MDNEIVDKVNELIDLLDNSEMIKNLNFHKKCIDDDNVVGNLIKIFKEMKYNYELNPTVDNRKKLLTAKINLYNNEVVKSYKYCENELYYHILYMNEKLSGLTNKNLCAKKDS